MKYKFSNMLGWVYRFSCCRGEPIPGACQIPVTKGNHLIPCVDRKVILRMSVHKRSCRMLVNYFIPEELDACSTLNVLTVSKLKYLLLSLVFALFTFLKLFWKKSTLFGFSYAWCLHYKRLYDSFIFHYK